MNEQEIRAKSLEIAAIILGNTRKPWGLFQGEMMKGERPAPPADILTDYHSLADLLTRQLLS